MNKISENYQFKSLLSYAQQLHLAVAGNEMLGSQALLQQCSEYYKQNTLEE